MRLSLLWKILLSTSIFITTLLALTGWFVQDQVLRAMSQNLQTEMQSSFRAYQSLWQGRAEMLRAISLVLSNMSDVRAAFGTHDRNTIQDTAQEIWPKVSKSAGFFLVTDPNGQLIASLGGERELGGAIPAVHDAAKSFPEQAYGFVLQNGRLYQMVVTPVYVQSGTGLDLLNVLVTGYQVDKQVASDLKARTGGSEFVFVAGGRALASTLGDEIGRSFALFPSPGERLTRVSLENRQYAVIGSPLRDLQGNPVGEILIVRPFEAVQQRLDALLRSLILTWLAATLVGLGMSFLFARHILKPVQQLDQAAARIARQDYETRVPTGSDDELGRLSVTFNAMCQSIQNARQELIRQERISTIGRLSTSIVHDLRNPLAAIYGGAEMLMDRHLNESQMQRLASNIYRSSRAVKDLLQELVDVSRQRVQPAEVCSLRDVIEAATQVQAAAAGSRHVLVSVEVAQDIELPLERARMERVFLNLVGNALEAMPDGGQVRISAERRDGTVLVRVEDTGPGIPADVRPHLFQPFVSGKKAGLGLGLALSRQTVLDHGGDLWAENIQTGACFWVKLPAK